LVSRQWHAEFPVAGFNLNGGVLNPELVVQSALRGQEEPVVASRRGHHQMGGERGFGGAHAPDMQAPQSRNSRSTSLRLCPASATSASECALHGRTPLRRTPSSG